MVERMNNKRIIHYTYDELNRLSSITYENGQRVPYSYDASGNINPKMITTDKQEEPLSGQEGIEVKSPDVSTPPLQARIPPPVSAQLPIQPPSPAGTVPPAPARKTPITNICPSCSFQIQLDARYCTHCGTALAPPSEPPQPQAAQRFCTHCGTALEAGKQFCTNCGQRI